MRLVLGINGFELGFGQAREMTTVGHLGFEVALHEFSA
jgi:hypothetical protein